MTRQLTGKCMCGAVQYSVPDSFEYALNCYCSECRRTTGSAFKPLAGIARAQLRLTADEENMLRYGSGETGHDAHCAKCGSLLYSVVRDGAYVHVAMGTLVDEPSIRPSMHIFVGSKVGWYDIRDGLPQFERFAE